MFINPKISRGRLNILQIADPHPDYEKWPLVEMRVRSLRLDIPGLSIDDCVLEPSYYVGALPRWWRWAGIEQLEDSPAFEAEPAFG